VRRDHPDLPFAEGKTTSMRSRVTKPVVVMHGGASNREHDRTLATRFLQTVTAQAQTYLQTGAEGVDVAEWALVQLELSGLYNAGQGASSLQRDAGIMVGSTQRFGGISLVNLATPIRAARLVMERTPHVLLAGPDAERWALEQLPASQGTRGAATEGDTVGIVLLDVYGELVAAGSTGGTRHKLPGRVSGVSQPGLGTYADNTCAVAVSGHGETFMEHVTPHAVAVLRHRTSLEQAAVEALQVTPPGTGGLIAVDCTGQLVVAYNSRFFTYATAS